MARSLDRHDRTPAAVVRARMVFWIVPVSEPPFAHTD
jgi:hypothetical protein